MKALGSMRNPGGWARAIAELPAEEPLPEAAMRAPCEQVAQALEVLSNQQASRYRQAGARLPGFGARGGLTAKDVR